MIRAEAQRLLALALEARLEGPDAAKWVERLSPQRQSLVDAVRFLAENGDEEAATQLAANVWRLWLTLGDVAGGRELLRAALSVGEGRPSRARALALYGDGLLAFRSGAQTESQARNQAALDTARAVGDREAEALALVGLSRVALRAGDYTLVCSLADRAREITRNLDPTVDVWPLHLLAAGTRLSGDYDKAIALYTESLELNRRLGNNRMVCTELHNIGHVELHRGNVDAARRCFADCAEIRNPNDLFATAMTHLNQAALAFAQGERETTAERLQRMQATLYEAGIVLDPDDAFEVKWLNDQFAD